MHNHGSFLEMKVIIQLSGLIGRLEDTDREQKPVQLFNRHADGASTSVVVAKGE